MLYHYHYSAPTPSIYLLRSNNLDVRCWCFLISCAELRPLFHFPVYIAWCILTNTAQHHYRRLYATSCAQTVWFTTSLLPRFAALTFPILLAGSQPFGLWSTSLWLSKIIRYTLIITVQSWPLVCIYHDVSARICAADMTFLLLDRFRALTFRLKLLRIS